MEQQLYELPEGWEWRPLGEVATLINGRAYKQKELLKEGPVPVLRVGNFFSNRSWYYSDLELPPEKYCEEGDLLYAWSASFGPKIWRGPKAIFHYHIWKIVTSDLVDKYYLCHLLELDSAEIKAQGNGVAMTHATKGGMEKRCIPLPPLNEQKRIVAKLDAIFARINTAITHLQGTLELSKALFASALNTEYRRSHSEWQTVSLEQVCSITAKLADPREPEFIDMLHVGGANIESLTGKLSGLKTAREEKLISGKFPFDGRMVLYSKIRPYLMKVARPDSVGLCSADIYPLTPDNQLLFRDYLYYLLLTENFTDYANQGSSRAGMPKVNRKHLFNYKFDIPPISVQKSIVAHLDALADHTRTLEAETLERLDQLTALKSSLLDAAFRGQLLTHELKEVADAG